MTGSAVLSRFVFVFPDDTIVVAKGVVAAGRVDIGPWVEVAESAVPGRVSFVAVDEGKGTIISVAEGTSGRVKTSVCP